jgi:UDP-N-acetyl-D-glucosamine dehydrogenase
VEEARGSGVDRCLDDSAGSSHNGGSCGALERGGRTAAPYRHSPVPPLSERILDRSACVSVLGLGHVGLPLAAAFARAGFRVLGYDVDAARVAALQRGERVLPHLDDEQQRALRPESGFEAMHDSERLVEADAHFLCVPTPLGSHREPDLQAVEASARTVARVLRKGALVVLCSTTYPGTTREVVAPLLAASGLRPGVDFDLAYAPEREDPGRKDWPARSVPRLVGGLTPHSGALCRALLAQAYESVVPVSSCEVAEAAKLLENVFRAVNIALVNELKLILSALGIDPWEVVEAAATKPYGYMRFDPGPGLGGHCIPIDPFYLAWAARRAGRSARFVELAGEINTAMPEHVVERVMLALNERGRALRGARILLLGVAYKADVADVREAPALRLAARLHELGAHIAYSDPHVPVLGAAEFAEALHSVPLTQAELEASDVVLVVTAHRSFDWELVARHARLVVDTRHVLAARMAGDQRYVEA